MASFLVNLTPADMADLELLQAVRFSVSTEGAAQNWIAVWYQVDGSDDKVLIYEGGCGGVGNFSEPFDLNSTAEDPEGDQTTITFAIRPELGWTEDVSELRIVGEPAISTAPFP